MEGNPVLRLKPDKYVREYDTNSTNLQIIYMEVLIANSPERV
jgi:hypothetical protein